ncbi:MAG: PorV/PorQ family protein [bacterium]|nr:PorV/PorQ family protein [bacterium]
MRRTHRWLGRALAVALTVCLLAVPARALEKIGTTSLQVLKIAQGVRGIAMGNAMTATARDVEAVWSNPGALTEIKGQQALFSQINMPADVHLNSVAFARQWGDYGAVSLHAINLFTNDMKVRTWERPEGTGEFFNAWDLVVGAGYARKLTDRFSLGANVHYLHSRLEDETYDGVAVDLGTLYKTDLRSMRLGMAIQNLGPDVKYSGAFLDYRNRIQNDNVLVEQKYEGASLPTVFRLGVAFDVYELLGIAKHPDYAAQFSVEMNHPNDNRERLNIGAEGGYRNQLFLRLGGKFAYDEESFAAGFGLLIPVFDGYKVKFDYAYSYWGRLTEAVSKMDGADQLKGQPHRFAIGLEW